MLLSLLYICFCMYICIHYDSNQILNHRIQNQYIYVTIYVTIQPAGYVCKELRDVGYPADDLLTCYTPEELARSGFTKSDLKPLGAWPHDGEWQMYNQYWGCCYSLTYASRYCQPIAK